MEVKHRFIHSLPLLCGLLLMISEHKHELMAFSRMFKDCFGASEVRWTRASSCCFMACFVSQDAHNCIPGLDDETAMFAVYDGHGGNVYSPQPV